jgi:hypothetical protein
MSAGASISHPSSVEILNTLREQVPELEDQRRWPVTLVVDAFADHVADRLRAGAGDEEVDAYFAFVEDLAASGDPDAENLVTVDFLEAADWPAVRLGPTTKLLAERADDHVAAPATKTDRSGAVHAQLLERFPELGDLCIDDVLAELAQLAWEAHVGDRPDLARRVMASAEWLAERGREDLAERAVSPLFDARTGGRAGAGPRVVELLRRAGR